MRACRACKGARLGSKQAGYRAHAERLLKQAGTQKPRGRLGARAWRRLAAPRPAMLKAPAAKGSRDDVRDDEQDEDDEDPNFDVLPPHVPLQRPGAGLELVLSSTSSSIFSPRCSTLSMFSTITVFTESRRALTRPMESDLPSLNTSMRSCRYLWNSVLRLKAMAEWMRSPKSARNLVLMSSRYANANRRLSPSSVRHMYTIPSSMSTLKTCPSYAYDACVSLAPRRVSTVRVTVGKFPVRGVYSASTDVPRAMSA